MLLWRRTRPIEAMLFDMDGTILTSIAAAERIWSRWAAARGLDVVSFLPTIHGVQAVETIRRLNLAGVDPEVEAAAITAMEIEDLEGVKEIDGAATFLASLPGDRWGIVTSAPRALALRRLTATGLPIPDVLVTAEDVMNGKPAPDCFILAASRLGVAPANCLVFEDAAAGIAAAQAAGARVVVVTATHADRPSSRHLGIESYRGVRAHSTTAGSFRLVVGSDAGPLPGCEHLLHLDPQCGVEQFRAHLQGLSALPESRARNTAVVIGSGLAAIDLAADLPRFMRSIYGEGAEVRVVIIEQGEALGPELDAKPQPDITEALQSDGVECFVGTRVTQADAAGIYTSDGDRIDSFTVIWTQIDD